MSKIADENEMNIAHNSPTSKQSNTSNSYPVARRKNVRGFTLIEVMIALIFFALIGVVLQEVTASTVNQYEVVRYKTFATWIAQNKLAELRVSEKLPAAKEYKEEVSFADMKWELVSKVKATENPDIHRVEVEVYYQDEYSDKKYKKTSLTGFIGRY